ncbi:hypothetical protein ANO11243_002670 [Dothideomycetidae sp. 11243]|nr:hypothetical protein ANO11243_002670 [fungal sp. No.11243]
MSRGYVSLQTTRVITISMLVLTGLVVLLRLILPLLLQKQKKQSCKDAWLLAAFVFYVGLSALFLVIDPMIFRIADVIDHRIPFYPTLLDDVTYILRTVFPTTILQWLVLWSVKFSLLAFYKQLMARIQLYVHLWWSVAVISCLVSISRCSYCSRSTILTMSQALAGCLFSLIFACGANPGNTFVLGRCQSKGDIRGTMTSLWTSYALDVLTDVMSAFLKDAFSVVLLTSRSVMLLPLGLIFKAQMPLKQKLSIGSVFAFALICVAAATIRVCEVGETISSHSARSVIWLTLWSIIECSVGKDNRNGSAYSANCDVAVIIGCAPGLYELFRRTANDRENSRSLQYSRRTQVSYTPAGGTKPQPGRRSICVISGNHQRSAGRFDNDSSGSQEQLTLPAIALNKICMTRSTVIEDTADEDHDYPRSPLYAFPGAYNEEADDRADRLSALFSKERT